MFREQPTTRAISEIETPSDFYSRRISAQSSTISTCFLPGSTPARSRESWSKFSWAVAADKLTAVVVSGLKASIPAWSERSISRCCEREFQKFSQQPGDAALVKPHVARAVVGPRAVAERVIDNPTAGMVVG